jgi:hypothetical protein
MHPSTQNTTKHILSSTYFTMDKKIWLFEANLLSRVHFTYRICIYDDHIACHMTAEVDIYNMSGQPTQPNYIHLSEDMKI